ncbi:hypothetical protein NCC49_003792 [Naganishia albida]|nr:hypothetical protein NCC49_003792 [Naganishia albida]
MQAGGISVNEQKAGDEQLHYGDGPVGPGPSKENPAGVFPHSAPEPADAAQQNRRGLSMRSGAEGEQAGAVPAGTRGIPGTGNPSDTEHDPRVVFSNPMLFQEVMGKLSHSLTETINAIKDEAPTGIGGVGRALIAKFEAWRDEVEGMQKGEPVAAPEGQGNVEMSSESGLYTD